MIYPDWTPDKWRTRFKLKTKSWKCIKCSEVFEMNVPVMMGDCVGLESPIHGCGEGFVAVYLKPYTKDGKEFWGRVGDWVASGENE